MSWISKINNVEFQIKTGDGKIYKPLYSPGEKSKEYNTSVFDFIDVPGSLVERKNPKGGKHTFLFYFQGEDCLDVSESFEVSADDRRYWTVLHPYYGELKGQPISINRSDANLNIVSFSVEFYETIVFDFPYTNLNVQDNVLVKKNAVLEQSAASFASKQQSFEVEDIQKMKLSNEVISESFKNVQTNDTFSDYQNALSEANKAADLLRVDAFQSAMTTQALLNGPSTYDTLVKPRIQGYKNVFNAFEKILNTIFDKSNYETQAGTTIASMCNAAVNYNENDYVLATEVDEVVNTISDIYNEYLQVIDNATVSGTINNNWQPDTSVQIELNNLVIYTISNIYDLAFDAMQERSFNLRKDSNIIVLTHQLYGLASDENITNFKAINNIKLNELFKIKKGRLIKYYR